MMLDLFQIGSLFSIEDDYKDLSRYVLMSFYEICIYINHIDVNLRDNIV